jgi:hypothetical protein
MRNASAALVSFLDNPANLFCIQIDLYTFALTSGETLRWSGGDVALTVPSAGFPTGSLNYGSDQNFVLGPKFGRSKVSNKIGVQAAELDIDIIAGVNDTIGTFTVAEAVRLGLFDGATVELDRFFATQLTMAGQFIDLTDDIGDLLTDDLGVQLTSDSEIGYGAGPVDTSLGCLIWFYGRVAECDIGRSKITMKVKSLMNLLTIQQMPRRLYGAACTHIYGDTMCGYDRVNGKNALGASTGIGQITVTAASGSTQYALNVTSPPAATYVEGTIIGLTGANAGYTRTVSNLVSSYIIVPRPFLFPVTVGDTFIVLPGCDHTTYTCNNVMLNLLRFGGFAYIPPPEQAV